MRGSWGAAHESPIAPSTRRQGTCRNGRARPGARRLFSVAHEWDCDTIALGHTADDQVETMLYRLGRYGGLAAFRGMLPSDPPWVRPLLACRREETARYCRDHGLDFAEDRGNTYPGYARTGIRERVLPVWEAGLPGAVEAAARAAEVAAEMEWLVGDLLAEANPKGADAEDLSVTRLLQCAAPLRRLLLHQWLEGRVEGRARPPASRAAVLAVEALLGTPASAERALGGGWHARKEYDRVFLEHGVRTAPPVPPPMPLSLPGEVEWDGMRIRAERVERFVAPDPTREAYVDARSLSGPLVVRAPLPGDRLRPLGAPGTRKLQDVMVDLRVPARARARTPLVMCGDRIVWVCGLVMAEEGRIGRDTTSLVRFDVTRRRHGDAAEAGD